jgi:hypothetical protein
MKKKTITRLSVKKTTVTHLTYAVQAQLAGGEAVSAFCGPTTRKQDFPVPVFTAYDSCDCIIVYFHTQQPSCVSCPAPCLY